MEPFVHTHTHTPQTKQGLISVPTTHRNVTFKLIIWNFQINKSEAGWMVMTLPVPPPRRWGAWENPFSTVNTFLSILLLLTTPSGPSACWLLLLFSCPVMCDSFVTPWTTAHQAPLSMEFPRQEYWSRLPLPSPGDLPNPGMEPCLLHWQADTWATREASVY